MYTTDNMSNTNEEDNVYSLIYLYAQRIKLKDASAHKVLPEVISKEPLGPLVRHGDNGWADIVRWTIYAIFIADERGVTSANIDEVLAAIEVDADGNVTAGDPELARLFGKTSGELQSSMGLSADAFYSAHAHHPGEVGRMKIDHKSSFERAGVD